MAEGPGAGPLPRSAPLLCLPQKPPPSPRISPFTHPTRSPPNQKLALARAPGEGGAAGQGSGGAEPVAPRLPAQLLWSRHTGASCFTDSFSFQLSWVITGAWARGAVGYVLVPTPRTCECVGPYLGIGSLLMQEGLRGSRPGKAPHPADRGGPVTEMESRPFHSHSLQGGDPLTEPGKPEGLSREGEQALR